MDDLKSAFRPPESVRSSLEAGLAFLAHLDEEGLEKLLGWARVPRAGGQLGDVVSLVSEAGIPHEHANSVLVATAMMVGTLSEDRVTVDEFVSAGLATSAFAEEHSPGIRRLAELIVGARPALQEQANIARLQNVVLPTLTRFELALDARVQISDGVVVRCAPVVVAYADTDSENQVIWFQMDEARVRDLQDKLMSMVGQIETLKGRLSAIAEK